MAARLNPSHDARTRDKIKTSQLINRLTKHALGEVEMKNSQVRAAEVLLRKTIPDLSSVEATGEGGGPLVVEIVKFAKDPNT